MRKQTVAAALTAALAASCVSARPAPVWVHPPGMSDEQALADITACQQQAATVQMPYQSMPYVSPAAGAGGIIGAAIGMGLARGIAQGQARRRALETCLQGREHVPVRLTREQSAQLDTLPVGPERAALMQTFAEPVREAARAGLQEKAAMLEAASDAASAEAGSAAAPETVATEVAAESAAAPMIDTAPIDLPAAAPADPAAAPDAPAPAQ